MFRFTIREIVLVTLVAGVGLGWFLELRKRQRVTGVLRDSYTTLQNCESKCNELVTLIEARGGKV